MNNNKKWTALYTRPRHEFKAEEQLTELRVEHYLPTITRVKQWSDRKKKIVEPVFKSYIFIFSDEKERLAALQQNAIVKSVTFAGKPAVIPEIQIENLKQMISSNREIYISNRIQVGTRVRVIDGPFEGIEGVVYHTDRKEEMLAINIDLLNRSVSVQLPKESVTKIA